MLDFISNIVEHIMRHKITFEQISNDASLPSPIATPSSQDREQVDLIYEIRLNQTHDRLLIHCSAHHVGTILATLKPEIKIRKQYHCCGFFKTEIPYPDYILESVMPTAESTHRIEISGNLFNAFADIQENKLFTQEIVIREITTKLVTSLAFDTMRLHSEAQRRIINRDSECVIL